MIHAQIKPSASFINPRLLPPIPLRDGVQEAERFRANADEQLRQLQFEHDELAKQAKYITTTAKVPHPYEFVHDEIGYNYRMPNLNAALGCAQMERLNEILAIKTKLADQWGLFFDQNDVKFVRAINENKANHWLNTLVLNSKEERDNFLKFTNDNGVMTRPIWTLISKLSMYKECQTDGLENSLWLEDRVVNIPSSVPNGALKKLDK